MLPFARPRRGIMWSISAFVRTECCGRIHAASDDVGGMPVPDEFAQKGPKLGERFPDVRLPDQHGTPVDLHRARGGRRALVHFYRSARW